MKISVQIVGLDRIADRLRRGAPEIARRALEREGEELLQEARARWPVGRRPKRRRSRDSLRRVTRTRSLGVEVAVGVDPRSEAATYAADIRDGEVVRDLLHRPGRERAPVLAATLAEQLARLARGR